MIDIGFTVAQYGTALGEAVITGAAAGALMVLLTFLYGRKRS